MVKSRKSSRSSRKTSKHYVEKSEKGLGECRGKRKSACNTDPNCSYRQS